jgi:hypothetical protein
MEAMARPIQKIYEADPLVLSELEGRSAGHQQHRRPIGHPGHPQISGHLARPVQAAPENP